MGGRVGGMLETVGPCDRMCHQSPQFVSIHAISRV